jgi:DNA uptake protein ComE-like DNA-binding protein
VVAVSLEGLLLERERHGQFQNLVDFQRRLGLPMETTVQLMHYLQF